MVIWNDGDLVGIIKWPKQTCPSTNNDETERLLHKQLRPRYVLIAASFQEKKFCSRSVWYPRDHILSLIVEINWPLDKRLMGPSDCYDKLWMKTKSYSKKVWSSKYWRVGHL